MGEQPSGSMNLDLNLGPVSERESGLLSPSRLADLNEWVEGPLDALRDALRLRLRPVQIPNEVQNITVELNQLVANSRNEDALQTGGGSVADGERFDGVSKLCENNNALLEEPLEKRDEDEKGNENDCSFFDCNICLELAWEPVVTSCGHLFCWPCLYRWLTIHSEAKECPVCKGEVTTDNVTPIYGRGCSPRRVDNDPAFKFPSRPSARRVESWRQTVQRNGYGFPMEEMLRRIGSRFEYDRDLVPNNPHRHTEDVREFSERMNSLLNRILTSRALRREQLPVLPPMDIMDLNGETSTDTEEPRRLQSLFLSRAHLNRTLELDRLAEATFHVHPIERNQEQPTLVDGRDSFSSIAAAINFEGQTMDTAVEIESMVSISSSSSRMRNDASRTSDIDNGDSRAHRRRRLN